MSRRLRRCRRARARRPAHARPRRLARPRARPTGVGLGLGDRLGSGLRCGLGLEARLGIGRRCRPDQRGPAAGALRRPRRAAPRRPGRTAARTARTRRSRRNRWSWSSSSDTSPSGPARSRPGYSVADDRSACQSPGRRSVDPPNVPSRATSATVHTAATPGADDADEDEPDEPQRRRRCRRRRRSASRSGNAVESRVDRRTTPRRRRCRTGIDQRQEHRGRQPESGQRHERVAEAGPDRAAQRRPDAVAGQGDPSRRDGPDHLAEHPGDDDRDDHLGRGAQDAQDDRRRACRAGWSARGR